jgi:hypothetical protein
MSAYDQQQEIIAELKKVTFGPTPIQVYEGAVDDGTQWLVEMGVNSPPYMTIQFGGFAQTAKNIKSLVGARHNSREVIFSVTFVGTKDADTRKVWDKACTQLIGFVPQNAGEIQEAMFASPGQISFLGSPSRYTSIQSFTFLSNSFATC